MQVNLSKVPVFTSPDHATKAIKGVLAELSAAVRTQLARSVDGVSTELSGVWAERLLRVATTDVPMRATAAWVLLTLAYEGHLMLPANAGNLRAFSAKEMVLRTPDLFAKVDRYIQEVAPRWLPRDEHHQILLATNCREAGEFDIHQYAVLHGELIRGKSAPLSLATSDYMLLRGLERALALRRDQRHLYILWRASAQDARVTFIEFLADPDARKDMRIHGHVRERIELPTHVAARQLKESSRKARLRLDRPESPFVTTLRAIAESDAEDAPERYFEELRGASASLGFRPLGWLENPVDYPGREGADIKVIGKFWIRAIGEFLVHRSQNYEDEDQIKGNLAILLDYILLYLPMWFERNPGTKLDFPDSPKKLLRYFYVERTRYEESDASKNSLILPKTLAELLPSRRPTPGARNTARIHWEKFFSFVITFFEDSPEYVSKGMLNPIRTDFDNEVAGKPNKSNKLPFSEDLFPFLVYYGQALESFGEYIQSIALELDAFKDYPFGVPDGYFTSDWGYVPTFRYRGELYRVEWIPNIYLIASRDIYRNPAGDAGVYCSGFKANSGVNRVISVNLPHLTVVRMLNVIVETGLRGQSVQWLDRRKFDSLSAALREFSQLYGSPAEQTYSSLFVNTDKSHDEWDNLVSWRVRRALIAEARFQDGIADNYVEVEVRYEDRAHTRFAPVLALFRSNRGAAPFSDSAYYRRWIEFLYGFQDFYNSKGGNQLVGTPEELVLLTAREDASNDAAIADKFVAIHSPHSCRTTFATLKDGDFELSEIAYLLGHSNTKVTGYYQKPNAVKLKKKLMLADAKHFGEIAYDVDGVGEGYLHPERAESGLRIAFQKNREQAIADFGFVPGVALWSLEELNGDRSALELLRQSPSGVIKWHATHVCPVGNQCPREVVANTGGMNRCGICPLAAKCLDHLPGIEAKQTELHERIRASGRRLEHLLSRKAPQVEVDAVHREMQLDTKELLGWKLSAEILRNRQQALGNDGKYHVDQPELVRKQLELVSRSRSDSEFFLQRISDSNAYPSLESPEIRAKAVRFTRLILANQGRIQDAAFLEVPEHTELAVFASMVKPFIEAHGVGLEQLAEALEAPSSTDGDEQPPLLLVGG